MFSALAYCGYNSSPGPGGTPYLILNKCRYAFTLPLYTLFSLSLSSGIFPDNCKSSFVRHIFKNGDRSNISLTSSIPKLFESSLFPKLNLSFSKHLILQQYGLRSHRSTMTNLISYSNFLVNAVEKCYQVDFIYTDVSKVFDLVNHIILVKKIELISVNDTFY